MLLIYNFFTLLFAVFISLFLITGIFLIIRAIYLRKLNVFYIGIAYILIGFGFIGNLVFKLGIIFEEIFVSLGFSFVALFTYTTFYKNRNNIAKYFLTGVLSLLFVHFILKVFFSIQPDELIHIIRKIFDVIGTFSTFAWMGLSSLLAYQRIKDENIQQWIKTRYKLFSYSALLLSVQAIPELFLPYNVSYGDPDLNAVLIFGFTLILSLIFSIGFLFAWIIPKQLKKINNKLISIWNRRKN
ncbi:MAG: hypothetical protein GF311_26015 [Candidatus Lokiarchaeota archaeon]|nr:hypothetical protein [Candidatus Lokiarchaeota archaeon]